MGMASISNVIKQGTQNLISIQKTYLAKNLRFLLQMKNMAVFPIHQKSCQTIKAIKDSNQSLLKKCNISRLFKNLKVTLNFAVQKLFYAHQILILLNINFHQKMTLMEIKGTKLILRKTNLQMIISKVLEMKK